MRYLLAVGANRSGQLGIADDAAADEIEKPCLVRLPEDAGDVVDAAAGSFHSIAVCSGGAAFVWGCNRRGQCGVVGATVVGRPTAVCVSSKCVRCAAAANHSMLLTDDGHVLEPVSDCIEPWLTVPLPEPVCDIVAGPDVSFAITVHGLVYAWGHCADGANARLLSAPHVPRMLQIGPPNTRIAKAECGAAHTVFLSMGGDVYVRGSNAYHQLGLGREVPHVETWALLRHVQGVRDIAATEFATVLITADGQPMVCGTMDCGCGVLKHRFPVRFPRPIRECVSIAAGRSHVLVVTTNGKVFGVGRNSRSQLARGGAGSTEFQQLVLPDGIRSFGARCGTGHSLILASDEEIINMGFFYVEDVCDAGGGPSLTIPPHNLDSMSFARGSPDRGVSWLAGAVAPVWLTYSAVVAAAAAVLAISFTQPKST